MTRSVDNRIVNNKELVSVNSYVRVASSFNYLYVADEDTILEFEADKKGPATKTITLPADSVNLKLFSVGETLFSLTFTEANLNSTSKICIN